MTSQLDSRYGSDDASPGFMLWRVTNRWQALMRRTLAPFELTHVQFVLLATLAWRSDPDGTTQSELAQGAGADPMMVSQVIRALEGRDLVARGVDASDKRVRRVRVTAGGLAVVRAAVQVVEAADEAFFGADSTHPQPLLEHLARLDSTSP